jgi:hypothetical protein
VAIAACIDTDAITDYDHPPDGGGADAAETPCLHCIEGKDVPGGGCAAQIADCRTFDPCAKSIVTSNQAGCFGVMNESDFTNCIIQATGNVATTPDSLQASYALYSCITTTCAKICFTN